MRSARVPPHDDPSTRLDDLLAPDASPFVLLHRPWSGQPDRLTLLTGDIHTATTLAEIPLGPADGAGDLGRHDLVLLVPYRQLAERGLPCHDDGTPLCYLRVRTESSIGLADALDRLPTDPVAFEHGGFDLSDQEYGELVRQVVDEEIGRGEGANFVIRRSFTADITDYSTRTALAIFRYLLARESGSYWTFLVHTGDRTLVGASPERHVGLTDGTVTMNPISGTCRFQDDRSVRAEVLRFLADRKEINELYMVLDEELKMMARICEPGIRLRGPFLREMAHLAHTEYELVGRSTRGVLDILRETLFAPTVTGSPMPSACAVIDRYERGGRGYYSGVLALVGRDDAGGRSLDSAILIRTADIRADGRLSIAVGATVVRDSVPAAEAAETRSKAATLIRAVGGRSGPVSPGPVPARSGALAADPEIRRALARRNDTLSTFWLADNVGRADGHAVLAGRRVDVIDAEDAFSEMIRHHLAHLGAQVTVYRHDRVPALSGADLVVVGPGPGDPTDRTSARITAVRRCVLRLLHSGRPLLAVCLGHQILADVLGLPLLRRPVPNQGVQLAVELSGRLRRVAFYNTFVAHADTDTMTSPLVGGPIRIDRDQFTGDVHRLGGATFESMQFHPESILTEDGLEILADAVWRLSGAVRRAG